MSICRRVFLFCITATTFFFISSGPARAIQVTLDYTYDTTNFFGSGNPAGPAAGTQARLALESAADFYSGILTDTFSAIETPAPFNSSVFNGMVTWSWSLNFDHPATGSEITLTNPSLGVDEYRIYAGARSLSGNTLGVGGPGGFFRPSPSVTGNGFTSAEVDQIGQITDDFDDAIRNREESNGFAAWGGAVTFDSGNSDWYFDHNTLPTPALQESDFFSVAIHEVGHALGFGTSSEWSALVSGGAFTGSKSRQANGNVNPPVSGGHWLDGTNSTILGTSTSQETAMDPIITSGTRTRLTTLDAAGLDDIGWTVVTPTFSPADYNFDGDVDAGDLATLGNWYGINGNGDADGDSDTDGADFLAWQRQFTGPLTTIVAAGVPEPGSVRLLLIGLAMTSRRRC